MLMWQEHYPRDRGLRYEYKPVLPRVFLQVNYLDWDSDGDGVWDGNDDQDNDGVSNVDEVQPPYNYDPHPRLRPVRGDLPAARRRRPQRSLFMWNGDEMRRHPYNPCLPYRSDTCARFGLRD